MLIDIEAARSPRRAPPQVSFRRNDNDRRPARPVCRPNDYAPNLEARLAASEARRQALEAKRIVVEAPEKDERRIKRAEAKTPKGQNIKLESLAALVEAKVYTEEGIKTQMMVLRAIIGGCCTDRDLKIAVKRSKSNVRRSAIRLEDQGLITSIRVPAPQTNSRALQYVYEATNQGHFVANAYWMGGE